LTISNFAQTLATFALKKFLLQRFYRIQSRRFASDFVRLNALLKARAM